MGYIFYNFGVGYLGIDNGILKGWRAKLSLFAGYTLCGAAATLAVVVLLRLGRLCASWLSTAIKRRLPPDTFAGVVPKFSLATLLVAVNVAGIMVWLNSIKHTTFTNRGTGFEDSETLEGWPLDFYASITNYDVGNPFIRWYYLPLAVDIAVALLVVCVAAIVSESFVYRFRKAKRHDG